MTINTKKFVKFITSALLSTVLVLGFAFSIGVGDAHAQPGTPNAGDPGTTPTAPNPTNTPPAADEEELSCAIAKMGWILCPLIETSGAIGDSAFQFLSKTFLETEPELVATYSTGGQYSGTYKSWELARNIANVMFVIALLIIILSQVTGRGIDNYGIKKLLQRLIIAVIAVNVSYFICQAMVDLSNVLGYELQNFLVEAAREVTNRSAMPISSDIGLHTGGGTLAAIAAIALASTAIVFLLLPLLITGIGAIIITCIVIIAILLLRKAFIVLLVVVSPIAFVLYLLPNTEQFFNKWRSMFWKLLMVFPVIGLLMGAGQLASSIVLVAGQNTQSSTIAQQQGQGQQNIYSDSGDRCVTLPLNTSSGISTENSASEGSCAAGSTPLMLGLVAAGIAVAPLIAVWSVLKTALQGAGTIGGKISGAVETYAGKGGDKFKGTAIGKGWEARKTYRQQYKDKKFADRMSGGGGVRGRLTRTAAHGIGGNLGRSKLATKKLQYQHEQLAGQFAGAAAKQEDEAVQNKMAEFRNGQVRLDSGEITTGDTLEGAKKLFKSAVESGDILGAKAAESLLHGMGATGTGEWMKMSMDLQDAKKMGKDMAEELMRHTRNKHGDIKGTSVAADEWATNAQGRSFSEIARQGATYSNLSGDHVLGQTKQSLDAMKDALANPNTTDAERQAMQHAAQQAIKSQGFSKAKTGNQARMYDIAGLQRPDSLQGV